MSCTPEIVKEIKKMLNLVSMKVNVLIIIAM